MVTGPNPSQPDREAAAVVARVRLGSNSPTVAAGLEEGMAAETLLIEGRLRALVPCGSITE